jgi:hypothetical protein
MAYFLYTLSVFLACGVLEDCEAYFFAVRKNMWRQAWAHFGAQEQSFWAIFILKK